MAGGKPKKRLALYAAIVAVAVVAGVAIAVLTTGGGDDEAGEAGLDPKSPAGAANEALERGDPSKAIELLEARGDLLARDPMAQLILGHAHAARHDSGKSLYAYEQALKLDPQLEAKATLRANLRAMAADKSLVVVAEAFRIWAGRTQDPEARELLLKAAISQDLARRHGVRSVIEEAKLIDEVDWLVAYSFDLDQEPTCELRREAVAKLRALKDPRAVQPLERAVVRKHKTGAQRGKSFNPCLLDDAKAAIGFLRSLSKGT